MSLFIPFWGDDPLSYDRLQLNGRTVPGVVKSIKGAAHSGLDVRSSAKEHYADIVDNGYKTGRYVIEVLIGFDSSPGMPFGTAREQWSDYVELHEEIRPKRAQVRDAYQISHPFFALVNISRVYVQSIHLPDGIGPGLRRVRLDVIEYGRRRSAASGRVSAPAPKRSINIASLSSATPPSTTQAGP